MFEHRVLELLQGVALSFGIPVPIKTEEGSTIAALDDGSGKVACLFRYIEGICPSGDSAELPYVLGKASGELSQALASLHPELPPAYPPYYRLPEAYPACGRREVLAFCEQPPAEFVELQRELHFIEEAYDEALESLEGLEKLPHQLVHGDLNASNMLIVPDRPTEAAALLDFEFCTRDVRVMEPAVILSDLLGAGKGREAVRRFCKGFGSGVRLSSEEIAALPVLIRLRKVDVILHFLSRYWNGTDEPEVLRKQIQLQAEGLQRLKEFDWLSEELARLA